MQKITVPKIYFVARKDMHMRGWKAIFANHGLNIYDILTPKTAFTMLPARSADVIVVDVEDADFPFGKCEIIDFVLSSFPGKKVVAITNEFDPLVLVSAKKRGAVGYVIRAWDDLETISFLKRIAAGETFYMTSGDELPETERKNR